jgi:hypothetical protein
MGLAGSRAANEDHVLGAVHELATVQRPDSGLVDLDGGEVEADLAERACIKQPSIQNFPLNHQQQEV